jgi:hypothetical protein
MHISIRLRAVEVLGIPFIFAFPFVAIAQTFSPYTPVQIQEFNHQPIAPIQTPAGPVYMEAPSVSQKPRPPIDGCYFKNPDGEEQAEAQGAESVAPFEPIPATLAF